MPDLTGELPSALKQQARSERFGASGDIPVMLIHPSWQDDDLTPCVLWMHGRTVNKALDPGRYLRWMRAGIGSCAIDLPGHGDRFDEPLQQADRTLDVVHRMVEEIDTIVPALREAPFDVSRLAIGGMSAGGMAALIRLTRPHPFLCASVESTTGSFEHQRHREMFISDLARAMNPIDHLDAWREIPLQAIHTRTDEWVAFEGQQAFVDALRARYQRPELVELVACQNTGAPNEHAGFGRFALDAKQRQLEFFERHLR